MILHLRGEIFVMSIFFIKNPSALDEQLVTSSTNNMLEHK